MKKRRIDELESFDDPVFVYNILALQETFDMFLITIRAIKGVELKVLHDMDTVVTLNGKEVEGTRAKRFHTPEQLQELLNLLQLNKSDSND